MEKTYWRCYFEIIDHNGRKITQSKSFIESNTKYFPIIIAENKFMNTIPANFDKAKCLVVITNQIEISKDDFDTLLKMNK